MKFIDQKSEHLYLSLILGGVPKDQVQILCSGELGTSLGSVHASIIGASHFFELKNAQGKTIFSEVLACQKLDVIKTLFYDKVKVANNYSEIIDNISYKFKAEQRLWDADIMSYFKKLCDSSNHHAGFALRFQFPPNQEPNQNELSNNQLKAMTMLTVLEYPNKVRINSLHAYPNEKQLVLSQTTLKSTQK